VCYENNTLLVRVDKPVPNSSSQTVPGATRCAQAPYRAKIIELWTGTRQSECVPPRRRPAVYNDAHVCIWIHVKFSTTLYPCWQRKFGWQFKQQCTTPRYSADCRPSAGGRLCRPFAIIELRPPAVRTVRGHPAARTVRVNWIKPCLAPDRLAPPAVRDPGSAPRCVDRLEHSRAGQVNHYYCPLNPKSSKPF